jgi:hypothetical protein
MAVSGMGLMVMFIARADKFKPTVRGKALSSRRTSQWFGRNSTLSCQPSPGAIGTFT